MSFLLNKIKSVFCWWIDEIPTQTKRKREEEDDEEEEVVEEPPKKQLKIHEEDVVMLDRNEEEEEEFADAVGIEDEGILVPEKRKREEEEVDEVDEPLMKQLKIDEEEKEDDDVFHDAKEVTELSSDDEEEEAVLPDLIKALTAEEDERVSIILRPRQVGPLSKYKETTVHYKDIYKLKPGKWLNDEIITFYMTLLEDRAENDQSLPRIHCFNTFFCETLREQGYDGVAQWTQRAHVDIFEKDLVFIPIHRKFHWTLGVIDMKAKEIRVYDSISGNHGRTLHLLWNYLQSEHQDKKHARLNRSGWRLKTPKSIPLQRNEADCGVFVCCFAECLSRGGDFIFRQENISDVRRRMVLNILNKRL